MKLKKKLGLLIILIFTAVGLNGCMFNADPSNMAYHNNNLQKPANLSFINNITVSTVTGGEDTTIFAPKISNEGFKEALEQSLQNAHLYPTSNYEKYQLSAILVKLDQPFVGIDLTVTCTAHYHIIDIPTKRTIYDKEITTSYTATPGDSLMAVARMEIANEGAMKANIQKLIEDLYALPAAK